MEYEVIYGDRAQDDLDRTYLRILRFRGVDVATRWYSDIQADIKSRLSQFPEGFVISEDGCAAYPGTLVRQWVWGRGNGAFRVYFFVISPREDEGEIVGIVRVLRIRLAIRRPLSQAPVDEDNE